jgi:hypothetical protein
VRHCHHQAPVDLPPRVATGAGRRRKELHKAKPQLHRRLPYRESTFGAPPPIFPATCRPHEQSKAGDLVVDSLYVEAAGASWCCFGVHLDEPHTRRPSPSPEMHRSATTACMLSRAQAAVLLQIRVAPFLANAGEHLPVIPSLSSLRFASHTCPQLRVALAIGNAQRVL